MDRRFAGGWHEHVDVARESLVGGVGVHIDAGVAVRSLGRRGFARVLF
jgi:hypothetical protein